tara:strand:+ start:946 stop:1119 length:174 start_codon:yes stop_codon:yes gene_type:complete
MTPLYKPKKQLSKLQVDLMKEHSKKHSKEHNKAMRKYMKQGYCFQQSHTKTMKEVGK